MLEQLVKDWNQKLGRLAASLPFSLIAIEEKCGSGHPIIVLHQQHEIFGGLVVAHIDEDHDVKAAQELYQLVDADLLEKLGAEGILDFPFPTDLEVVDSDAGRNVLIKPRYDRKMVWNRKARLLHLAAA